ncbi:hypothetical protein U2T19_001376 [Salmonella enterica]|nr:hypothetical protein [Salmonella enterica]EGI1953451.1 hypothetical protein [Salmonella enterica]EMA3595186.1 hypothetical protein [Salmonella enterica]
MNSIKITQDRYRMVYIEQNNVVIVHVEPYTVSVLTREQAEKFGFDISKMNTYEKISINGKPEDGYELVEQYNEYCEPAITRNYTNSDNLELDTEIEDILNNLK